MELPCPVLIIEDDLAGATRLERLLETTGMTSADIDIAQDVAQALKSMACRRYALALVDMYLPDGSGAEFIARAIDLQPTLLAVVTSSFGNDELVMQAIRAGAIGYLLKDVPDEELMASLACIERGGAPIHPGIARRVLALAAAAPATPGAGRGSRATLPQIELAVREREVLTLIAQGCTNKDVARKLSLSVNTIDFYAKRLYVKLSAHSRTQAVQQARHHGLLD